MSENKKTRRRRSKRRTPLRDKINPDEESLLHQIELDLYMACMDLDEKRKRRDYIV